MPVARKRQIATEALPGVTRTAAETDVSSGAATAQARRQTALQRAGTQETIANLGQAVANQGVRIFGRVQAERRQMAEEERQRADDVALVSAENRLATWERDRLYDPQKGALATKGPQAFTLPEDIDREFSDLSGEIERSLATPEQKARFAAVKARRGSQVGLSVRRHVYSEMQTYEAQELKARIDNSINLAGIKGVTDPRGAGEELAAAEQAIKLIGPRLGFGPEQITEQVAALRSAGVTTIIDRLLGSNKIGAAKVYFEEQKSHIAGDQIARIEKALTAATVEAQAERQASTIWEQFAPKNDTDPISLDVMEAEARKVLGDDTDTLKATISALRSRKQGVDDGRKERLDGNLQALYGSVLKGATWQQIRTMPEAVQNPTLALKIRDYLDTEKAREDSRAAAAESRASSRESRAWTAAQRRDAQLEIDGWARVRQLTTPSKLRELDKGLIMQELPNIGRANVDRVLREWESRTKDDATLRQLQLDDDLFKDVATAGGITYAYRSTSDQTNTQKANLGRLHAAVNDAIGKESEAKGRKLTPGEQRDVMTKIVDQKVLLNDFFEDTTVTALVVNAADRRKAYVPFDEVAADKLREFETFLRGEKPVTDAVKRTRIERAYARHLMGAGLNEIAGVLRGGE